MSGVATVVSHIGSAPVEFPHIISEVAFVSYPFIIPNARPSTGDFVTLNDILISPPAPLGFPGGIAGAELPSYFAVILTKPPTSSLIPLPSASPGLKLPD